MEATIINRCSKFDSCNAPICPVDLCGSRWYPDSDICTCLDFSNLPWVKNQRTISKKCHDTNSYFNLTMLSHNCQIREGIAGLDLYRNMTEKAQTKHWLTQHPEKKEMSDERKEASRKYLFGYKQGLITVKKDAQVEETDEKSALGTRD